MKKTSYRKLNKDKIKKNEIFKTETRSKYVGTVGTVGTCGL